MSAIDSIILNKKEIKELVNRNDYGSAASILIEKQLIDWPLLKENHLALSKIKIKEFSFNGFKIKAQYNPARIKSTSANTDQDHINSRECFLCPSNLHNEQRGILFKKKLLILCNPYPIFPEHLTISSVDHKPQKLENHFDDMLELTKNLAPHFVLIYNGAKCGASAPDHFHFQAGTSNYLPIRDDYPQLKNQYGDVIVDKDSSSLTTINDGLRRFILIESFSEEGVASLYKIYFDVYNSLFPQGKGLCFNLLSFFEEKSGWTLIIFPREKHRSSHYFLEGENKIVVSPAVIDLCGVLVTPREKDFVKMDKELVWSILNEVSLDKDSFSTLSKSLREEFS